MNFDKQIIDEIFKCYSVDHLTIDGETHLVFAGEASGICNIYSGENFEKAKTIWSDGGGTMSIVSVPEYEGYFFASKGFYSMVDSETSGVYIIRYKDGEFKEERIIDLPYLHRFDVLTIGHKRYFIGAALHSGKIDKQDWSNPGKLYIAEIPYDLDRKMDIQLTLLKDNLTKNHGFNRGHWDGKEVAYVATEEGVLAVIPPQGNQDEWLMETIFTHPVSDVAAMDIDGDGEVEFALISPFHGNQFDIYKKIDNEYKSVFKYHKPLDFYHAISADFYNGIPSFVIGARGGDMDLFLVQYDVEENVYKSHLIEMEAGSSNVHIIHTTNGDLIMSANRQINQAAIYKSNSQALTIKHME